MRDASRRLTDPTSVQLRYDLRLVDGRSQPASAMKMSDSPPPTETASTSKLRRIDHHRPHQSFFASCHEDLIHNILRRLPAPSFASAACVCKTWHRVSNRILSLPLLASALSLNPSPLAALQEALDKVLSEPIRPHFATVNVGEDRDLSGMLELTSKHLGPTTPIVVSFSGGVIGREASTGEVVEVQQGDDDSGGCGVVLTVGFVPGLQVEVIPLRQTCEEPMMVDQFVTDIREFSASVSGQLPPVGIIMFGDGCSDLKHVIEKLDYAMPIETAIIGDERGLFACQIGDKTRSFLRHYDGRGYIRNAVALTFVRDRNKIHGAGAGEIKFHVALSEGMSAFGPIYKAVSVRTSDGATWLTARREGSMEALDGQSMMRDIDNELENRIGYLDLYIGVTKRRKYAIGSETGGLMTSLSFHSVLREDEEYLYVDGLGIRTGDRFQFYGPDAAAASATCEEVREILGGLNRGIEGAAGVYHGTVAATPGNNDSVRKEEVFGGFIFSCCGRGEYFFGRHNADSAPFTGNFPKAALAGVFCSGEIGRRTRRMMEEPNSQASAARPVSVCSHVYSSVYLAMTYTPPQSPPPAP